MEAPRKAPSRRGDVSFGGIDNGIERDRRRSRGPGGWHLRPHAEMTENASDHPRLIDERDQAETPPHRGHASTSKPKLRCINCAQGRFELSGRGRVR